MIGGGHCCDVPSSEAEGGVEDRESCLGAERRRSNSYFLEDRRVFEDQGRRLRPNHLEKLHRERLRGMNTNACKTPAGKKLLGQLSRRSKKVVRRSSALVEGRREPVENSCCCSDSASPEPRCCQSRMNVVHDCGGSILRGRTRAAETQTSRPHSGNTSLNFSRTKGSGNWRTENYRSKFPPVTKISSAVGHRLPRCGTPSSDKCCCFSNTRLKRPATNDQQIRFHSHDRFPMSNGCVIATASTSEEEIIDYQVPIQPCSSSHRLYENGSETKTLVPTSSHVTIRICSRNSSSSLRCDQFDDEKNGRPRFSKSENSLNHIGERVRIGLRDVCSCDQPEDDHLGERPGEDEAPFKPEYSSLTECQISSNNFTPRSGKMTCCCKCREEFRPRIGFVETSDEGAFRRFKDVINETRRRRGQRSTSTCHSRKSKNCSKSGKTICGPNPLRRVVPKRLPRPKDMNPPVTLSAQKYKEFLNRCECIRNSIRNMKREENIFGYEPAVKESVLWKGDAMNLGDFKPDLPPLQHWSHYEDGMRKVANEYRTLKSCVNSMEAEAENLNPRCCCTEKSVTRTYPSGTEFTFRVKRAPDLKEPCQTISEPVEEVGLLHGTKRSGSTERSEEFRAKGRSVCFEKSGREKQPCCDCPEDVKPRCEISEDNGVANIETMRTREADLVRTLETFCEKIKTMKSEFDKSSTSGCFKDSGRCRSCGRGRKSRGCNRMKAKKLLIFPPEGEGGPPLTLYKNSSSVNCRVKGDEETGFRYNVIYIQRFVSSSWNPDKGTDKCCMDSG